MRMTTKGDASNIAQIMQEDSYYPFGLKLPSMSVINGTENKYTYNEKELVDDFGLNWYHYGARYYDPTLGRWHSIDPADEFYSPYVYCHGDPINFYDPNGKWEDPIFNGEIRGWFESGFRKYPPRKDEKHPALKGMVRNGGAKMHQGIDIYAKIGTPAFACENATVFKASYDRDWGDYVVLKANVTTEVKGEKVTETRYYLYAHLSKILVKVGEEVKEGKTIAKTGNSGNASNQPKEFNHLHFEVLTVWDKENRKRLDPINFMSDEFKTRENQKANQTGE